MFKDLSYVFRTMGRHPGVTVTILLTLTLGIGANTAMFSVVNAVLLRPLPYREPDRLVAISAQIPSMNTFGAFVEYNTYAEYWRARSRSFQAMSAYTPAWVSLTSGNEPERVFMCRVNAGFLSMIGVRPELGRDFLPEEDQAGALRVAMVSHRLWMRRFGGEHDLVGRPIVLDRNSYTVVGVLPADYEFYDRETDIYIPIAASTARVPGEPSVGVHARLKPGVPVAAAQAEIDGLCRRWVQDAHYPKDWGARIWTLRDSYVRDVRSSVLLLMIAVGLVLLMAAGNGHPQHARRGPGPNHPPAADRKCAAWTDSRCAGIVGGVGWSPCSSRRLRVRALSANDDDRFAGARVHIRRRRADHLAVRPRAGVGRRACGFG
jgi:hypothetical protein